MYPSLAALRPDALAVTSKDDIASVVRSVDRPVNVVVGLQGVQLSLADLAAIGVSGSASAARFLGPPWVRSCAPPGKCESAAHLRSRLKQ
jgi:hypothetical protein